MDEVDDCGDYLLVKKRGEEDGSHSLTSLTSTSQLSDVASSPGFI